MKRLLSVLIASLFIFALFSVPVFAQLGAFLDPAKSYDLITYDCITKTETTIDRSSIPSYSNMYSSTMPLVSGKYMLELSALSSAVTLAETRTILPGDGGDTRYPTPPDEAPYTGVIFLNLMIDTDGDGDADNTLPNPATGFLVAPDVLITCAHCLIYTGGESRVVGLRAYPQIHTPSSDDIEESYYVYPASWTYSEAYMDPSIRDNYDWCIIKLQSPLPGYIFECVNQALSPNMQVSVSGYPTDRDYFQYTGDGYIYSVNDTRIFHTCDTTGGMSGSPIYLTSSNKCIGVHNAGAPANLLHNAGIRFYDDFYDTICYVLDQ